MSHIDRPRLHDRAPRLAAARDLYIRNELAWDRERRRLIDVRADNEWSVAHRDLQLVRSGCRRAAARDAKYMGSRAEKLREASERLARTNSDLETLERIAPGTFDLERWRRRDRPAAKRAAQGAIKRRVAA